MKWTNFRGKDVGKGNESNIESEFSVLLQEEYLKGALPPFRTDIWVTLLATKPDFIDEKDRVMIFWDGPPHDKAKRGAKDDVQNGYLTEQGWKVLRLHYNGGKVSKAKQVACLQWVKEVLESPRFGHLWEYNVDRGEEL